MKNRLVVASLTATYIFSASLVFAQAFGEYGRSVGSIPHGKGVTGSKGSAGVSQGNPIGGGIGSDGQVSNRALPSRLVVSTNEAGLYPRQDDESQKLEQLSQGEILTPMMQSAGGNEWFMVKTQKGIIGWVKSAEVREDKVKNK